MNSRNHNQSNMGEIREGRGVKKLFLMHSAVTERNIFSFFILWVVRLGSEPKQYLATIRQLYEEKLPN